MENLKVKYLPPKLIVFQKDVGQDVLTLSFQEDGDWIGDYDSEDEWGDF